MKSQSHDPAVSLPLQGSAFPSEVGLNAHVSDTFHRLRKTLHALLSTPSPRIGQRLVWFGGLYLASLLSFGGLISSVRWTLERL